MNRACDTCHSMTKYPNTQRNPNDETPNIGTSGHSADRCHGSPHALNQTSLLSSIDLAEDQVEFLYRLPKQRRSLFQVVGFSCSRLVVATFFPRHCPSSTTTFGLGYFVIPWVFGCFVICHLWRSFIPCCLSQTRLTKRHSRLAVTVRFPSGFRTTGRMWCFRVCGGIFY